MTHKLIKTDNYLLVVDDSEIKVGDYFWNKEYPSNLYRRHHYKTTSYYKKIISHLPLNGSPILEGVDLLPPYSRHQEDGLENIIDEITSHWHGASEEMIKGWFKFGYEKAREKYKYTEEDVKAFLETFTDHAPLSYMKSELEKGLHKRIGTQYPTEFECEMEPYTVGEMSSMALGTINQKPKTITTAQGRQWVGKYKYNENILS